MPVTSQSAQSPIARKAYPFAFDPPARRKPLPGMDLSRWEWKRSHPRQWQWIMENADDKPFAFSLARALHDFGSLTPNQQIALDRIIQKVSR